MSHALIVSCIPKPWSSDISADDRATFHRAISADRKMIIARDISPPIDGLPERAAVIEMTDHARNLVTMLITIERIE